MPITVFPKLRGGPDETVTRTQDNVDQVLRPVAQALSRTPIMGVAPVWIALALDPAFANTGGQLAVAAYYKDPFFRVWAKGSLTSAAGVAAGALIATLPASYRPKETLRLAVPVTAGAQWLTISGTGAISTAFAIAAGGEIDLAFSFLAEQ